MKKLLALILSLLTLLSLCTPAAAVEAGEFEVPADMLSEEPEESDDREEQAEEPCEEAEEAGEEMADEEPEVLPEEQPEEIALASVIDSGSCGANVSWKLESGGKLTISGTGPMMSAFWAEDVPYLRYASDITAAVVEAGVTSVGAYAFEGCEKLSRVTLADSVSSIGANAFANCETLERITLPSTVRALGTDVFYHCIRLTSVNIPKGITCIPERGFAYCSALTALTLPDSIDTIGDGAFLECTSLAKLTLPAGVCDIGVSAFECCSALTDMVIPEGVTALGWNTFYRCSNLAQVTLPAGLTSLDECVFYDCAALQSITIPDGVSYLGQSVFEGCRSLASVKLGRHLEEIEEYAFGGLTALTEITIPASVTYLASDAFNNCKNLKKVSMLNPDVEMYGQPFRSCSAELTVWGVGGGATQQFLEGQGIRFVPVGLPTAPTLNALTNTKTGVKVSWKAVGSSDCYHIYRKEGSGAYKKIAKVSDGLSYVDEKVVSGVTYTYAVSASNPLGESGRSAKTLSIRYLSAPVLSTPENMTTNVRIRWEEVPGAEGYDVYRKTGAGEYTRIARVSAPKNYYSDASVKDQDGIVFGYKVVAYGAGAVSAYNTKSVARLHTPVITRAENTGAGRLSVAWDQNSKASGYEFKYRTGADTVKLTIGGNANLTRTVSGLLKGKGYTLNVRSYKKADGVTYYSGWSSSLTVKIAQ